MPVLLTSGANGPSTTVATWQLPSLTVAGNDVLLIALTQTNPQTTLSLPGGWGIDKQIVGGFSGDIRYAISSKLVVSAASPYADTFGLTSSTAKWGAVQLAFRATGSTFANAGSHQDVYSLPFPTNPTVTASFGAATTAGSVLVGYVSLNTDTGAVITGFTWPAGWTVLQQIPGSSLIGLAQIAYKVADGTETSVAVGVNSTKVASDVLLIAEYGIVPSAGPGPFVEFDPADGFVDVSADIMEWTIQRGASPELTGSSSPGSATIVLKNTADKYNPENASGPYYGKLHDGPRVWVGVNADGTIAFDAAKVVYGMFAGRITDLSPLPVGGASTAPTVELLCADPLEWISRQTVTLAPSTTRSQASLRAAVLTALGEVSPTLPAEPTTLPLSSANGLALGILDDLNRANGTRHFAKPASDSDTWYHYTAFRRTSGLDGTSDASLSASSDHVTGTSGFRVSADGVINQQRATVAPISFPALRLVWQPDVLPIIVLTGAPLTIWTDFGDYVGSPVLDITSSGSALTTSLTSFGDTAKLVLTSAGTTTITALDIRGWLVQRGSVESYIKNDATSQAEPRGVRAGPDLSGDYLGTLTSAKGFADHIVWRFGNSLYRPTLTVANWLPEQFALDLFDRISFTLAELSITDRIFEIVGLTHHGVVAALSGSTPVVYHEVTYVLQESRVQTATAWFTLDDSLLDGPAVLAY